jgi:hypothetical protein
MLRNPETDHDLTPPSTRLLMLCSLVLSPSANTEIAAETNEVIRMRKIHVNRRFDGEEQVNRQKQGDSYLRAFFQARVQTDLPPKVLQVPLNGLCELQTEFSFSRLCAAYLVPNAEKRNASPPACLL